MPINQSSENQLYRIYGNAGTTPALLIPALLFFFFGYAGVIMNSFVLFVTFRTKSLHGTANFLLALISIFEILHQSGHAIFLFITLSGINFISTYLAARLDLLMMFGLNSALFGMNSAAFDRLLAVIMPHRHRNFKKPIYLGAHMAIAILYGARCCYYIIQYYTVQDPDSPTTGCVSEVLSGPVGEIFFRDTAILNGFCVCLYVILWLIIQIRKASKGTNNRLLRSLVIILVVNIGAYFVTLGTYQILFHLPPSFNAVTIWHLGFISGAILNICAGCNAIVLYKSSTDYRKAFRYYLAQFLPKIGLPVPSGWSTPGLPPFRTTQVKAMQSAGTAEPIKTIRISQHQHSNQIPRVSE